MSTTPYARLLVSLNGGAAAAGGIEASASDDVDFVYESTIGWPSSPAPYLEIYEAPVGWSPVPSTGWVATDGGGWKYYGTTPPPTIAAPDAAHFGKVAAQLVVGGGLKDGVLSSDMTSGATVLVRSASVGLESVAARETTEFDAIRSWIGSIQRDLRLLEAALAGGVGVPTSRTVTAGAGLTGGGDLSADRTIDIAAADASITVNANSIEASGAFVAKDISTTGTAIVTKSGIGTTKTVAIFSINATASGSQVSAQVGGSAKHSGGTVHNYGFQNEPQGAARQVVRCCYGTGDPVATPPSSTLFYCDTSDPSYGVIVAAPCFVSTLGTGYRLVLNGGGVKENGSGRLLVQSAVAGEPAEFLASTSTGNTGARWQFTADAGTPTAGTFCRIGYGSGSFSTEVFSISSATATMGHVKINGVDIGWNVRAVAFADSPVTAAIGDRFLVDTTGGIVVINLPAVPSVKSARQLDIMVIDAKNNFAANRCTLTPNGAEKINNAASSVNLTTNGQSATLVHDGDSTNWWIV